MTRAARRHQCRHLPRSGARPRAPATLVLAPPGWAGRLSCQGPEDLVRRVASEIGLVSSRARPRRRRGGISSSRGRSPSARGSRCGGEQPMADLEAVHARHVDVEEHDVEGTCWAANSASSALWRVCPESLHLHVAATVLAAARCRPRSAPPERPGGRRGCRGRAPASKARWKRTQPSPEARTEPVRAAAPVPMGLRKSGG